MPHSTLLSTLFSRFSPKGGAGGGILRTIIIVLSVVVFSLFYLVGFDMPFEDNPTFNEPMLTDVLIAFMWIVFALALATAAWSLIKTARDTRKSSGRVLGVPVRKIALGITAFTTILLLASYLLSSTDPIKINGKTYDDPFWLSMAGMFIFTASTLLTIAIIAVVISPPKPPRREGM